MVTDKEQGAIRSLLIHPHYSSIHNSYTCLYSHIHASIHLTIHQLCASKPSYLTSVHPYLSVHFQVHPSTAIRTSFHMPLLYKSIHLSIQPYCFIPTHICMESQCSLYEMIGLPLCSSFDTWTLQTLVGSPAYPITHLSTTLHFFSLSFTTLLCILDETTKL